MGVFVVIFLSCSKIAADLIFHTWTPTTLETALKMHINLNLKQAFSYALANLISTQITLVSEKQCQSKIKITEMGIILAVLPLQSQFFTILVVEINIVQSNALGLIIEVSYLRP